MPDTSDEYYTQYDCECDCDGACQAEQSGCCDTNQEGMWPEVPRQQFPDEYEQFQENGLGHLTGLLLTLLPPSTTLEQMAVYVDHVWNELSDKWEG